MKRKAWRKNNWRELGKTMGRFLAMVCIVALGVGFFTGLKAAKPAMTATCNSYLQETGFYDFQLISSLGFGLEDPERFAQLDGVAAAEGGISADLLTEMGDNQQVFKTHLLGTTVNQVKLTAGRMPEAANEVLADDLAFSSASLGETLTVMHQADSVFSQDQYVIVGLCNSPQYLSIQRGNTSLGNGTVRGFLYLTEAGYNVDYFTEIYVRLEGGHDFFSKTYDELNGLWEPVLTGQLELAGEARLDSIKEEANEALAEAKALYEDAVQELEEGKAELEQTKQETQQQLDEAKQELDTAKAELDAARLELQKGERALAELAEDPYSNEELAAARQELDEGWALLEQGEKEYEQGMKTFQQQSDEAYRQLEAAKTQLEEAKAQLEEGEAQYEAGMAALDAMIALQDAALQPLEAAVALAERNVEEAQAELAERQAELARLEAEGASMLALITARAAVGAAETALRLRENELESAERSYELAKAAADGQIEPMREEMRTARKELDDGWKQYEEGKTAYEEAQQQLDNALDQLIEARAQLDAARKQLEEGEAALEEGIAEALAAGRRELDAGWTALYEGEARYEDGVATYEEGKLEAEEGFAEAEEEIADAQRELNKAAREIRQAELDIERLESPSYYVLTPMSNTGFVSFNNDTNIVEGIAKVFPLFFFLVAALVCSSTMTRMVEEQRTQNGTLKALGYSDGRIMMRYANYAGGAAVIGCGIGLVIGTFLFPFVIWEAYKILYHFGELQYSLDPVLALVALAASLLCSVGAACLAAWSDLQRMPAQLMRPKAPKAGKRILLEYITPLWRRLRFLDKVSLRNIFRYKKRLFMMMLGTGGCLALLIAGLGLRDSISNVADDQFTQITKFDYTITFAEEQDSAQQAAFAEALGENAAACVFVHTETVEVPTDRGNLTLNVVATSDPAIRNMLGLSWEGTDLGYPTGDGVYVSSALAEDAGIQVGDRLRVVLESNDSIEIPITGIFENYVYHYLYLTAEGYEAWFGITPEYKTAYAVQGEGELYAVSALMQSQQDVINVTMSQEIRDVVSNAMSSLNAIIVLVVSCAAALSFVVGYNLININITERVREIATVKVLGFYQKETHSYVFRESVILTVLGAIVGIPLGIWLHGFIMDAVRVDFVCFQVQIAPLSFCLAVVITVLVTLIVNWILSGKVDRINMAESLKSVE